MIYPCFFDLIEVLFFSYLRGLLGDVLWKFIECKEYIPGTGVRRSNSSLGNTQWIGFLRLHRWYSIHRAEDACCFWDYCKSPQGETSHQQALSCHSAYLRMLQSLGNHRVISFLHSWFELSVLWDHSSCRLTSPLRVSWFRVLSFWRVSWLVS